MGGRENHDKQDVERIRVKDWGPGMFLVTYFLLLGSNVSTTS